MTLVVMDYGLGNIYSVMAALRAVGQQAAVDSDGTQVARAEVLVVPGVAAFGAGMRLLRERGQAEALERHVAQGKPTIGLCLGAQMFLSGSDESPAVAGLGLAPGRSVRLDASQTTVPSQGWCRVRERDAAGPLMIDDHYMYFSHSYHMVLGPGSSVAAVAQVGASSVVAVYEFENILGVQFHPERSGPSGLAFLDGLLKRKIG